MNTMQPPKPGEVICPGGVAREVLGCQPRLKLPQNTEKAASILTMLERLGYAQSQLDNGAKDKRTL